jgi:ferrochelatase
MNISDVVNITEGELLNTPKIQSVNAATAYQSKIERGDLFFSDDIEAIESAIANGAYAVVFEGDSITPSDNEIAWIKVDDIKLASMKLARYVLLKKELDIYLFDIHEINFLKMILKDKKRVAFLSSDYKKAFEQIVNSNDRLFASSDKELLQIISTDIQEFSQSVEGEIIDATLFKTSFKLEGYIYQDMDLFPFHFDYILKIVAFCKKYEVAFSLDKIRYTKHLYPIFINNNLEQILKGRSDKVAIFGDNIKDIEKSREYIIYRMKWVKSIFLTPPKVKIDCGNKNPIWFENEEQIRDILKTKDFNYAFIYSSDKKILNSIKKEYSLFDL